MPFSKTLYAQLHKINLFGTILFNWSFRQKQKKSNIKIRDGVEDTRLEVKVKDQGHNVEVIPPKKVKDLRSKPL